MKYILVEKSKNQLYYYIEFLKNYLEKKIDISMNLVISLFERKIKKDIEKRNWNLIYEFSKNIEQFFEFEKKISIILY